MKIKMYSCPCALTEHHAMKVYWGSRGIAPRILDLGTRWKSVSRPGHFTPWYPLDRSLVGSQNRSRHGDEERNTQPLPGLKPLIIQSVAQSCIT